MITTTYKCDRCGHEQTDSAQMWHVGVKVSHFPGLALFQPWETSGNKLWCRKCVDELQLLGFPEVEKLPVEPQAAVVSLEDQIREIIREELMKEERNDE